MFSSFIGDFWPIWCNIVAPEAVANGSEFLELARVHLGHDTFEVPHVTQTILQDLPAVPSKVQPAHHIVPVGRPLVLEVWDPACVQGTVYHSETHIVEIYWQLWSKSPLVGLHVIDFNRSKHFSVDGVGIMGVDLAPRCVDLFAYETSAKVEPRGEHPSQWCPILIFWVIPGCDQRKLILKNVRL